MAVKTPKVRKVRARGASSCDCIRQVNEKLKDKGVEIQRDFVFLQRPTKVEFSPPIIQLVKLDPKSRTKVPTLMCSCCPFCGKRYE